MNDDCISRQAALDIIKRTNGDHAAAANFLPLTLVLWCMGNGFLILIGGITFAQTAREGLVMKGLMTSVPTAVRT